MKPTAHSNYRPDIDGLRAVAVMAVVFFHAFPNSLTGGFVGVDIFFIISGFLITGILLNSLHKGTFSFWEFYQRRILRIFPALIVVLVVCYTLGWLVLLPKEFRQLGKHIAGGATFAANLVFWNEAGYFDNASETKPLLHLWSLGVEEQYYIVWPCLLLMAWKWNWKIWGMIAIIIALSFSVNVHTAFSDPVQSFYSPVARFWELLLGSLLAYLQINRLEIAGPLQKFFSKFGGFGGKLSFGSGQAAPVYASNLQSVLGAMLIITAIGVINRDAKFPGWLALLPTIGAFLIISAGSCAFINRTVLSAPPMVWLGLVSYPLYLWHWPLLSFARIIENSTPIPEVRVGAVALSFVLAWLTYRWVECPLRFGQRRYRNVFGLLAAMTIIVPVGGIAYFEGNVRRATMTDDRLALVAKFDFGLHFEKWTPCPNIPNAWSCRILDPTRPTEIALVGDSHSVHLASGLAEAPIVKQHNIISRNADGCMPVMETEWDGRTFFGCDGKIDTALDDVIRSETIKMVMLSGHAIWKIRPLDKELQPKLIDVNEVNANASALDLALRKTLTRLINAGKKVVFFVDTPVLDFEPSECLPIRPYYFKWHTIREHCALDRRRFDQRNIEYHRIIRNAEQDFPSVKFIRLHDQLCDQAWCYAIKDGVLIYRDHGHLSAEGSRYLISRVADQIQF